MFYVGAVAWAAAVLMGWSVKDQSRIIGSWTVEPACVIQEEGAECPDLFEDEEWPVPTRHLKQDREGFSI